jgi:drug/metabolite transporter (DMT)-like permease
MPAWRPNLGISAAFVAALLFGIGTPLAKRLLGSVDPWLMAGLLYAGSGITLTTLRVIRTAPRIRPSRSELGYLAGAIGFGGVAAPVMLMWGLSLIPASSASLLLNAEGVFTAIIAWVVFRENVDRRIALGMLTIAAGAMLLSWSPGSRVQFSWPALLVLGACLAWGIDNNLTRKVSLLDATWIAAAKGVVAGVVNLSIAAVAGAAWPRLAAVVGALSVGAVAYGASLVLFVVALRHLGAARTTAYFSAAPFAGAVVAIVWLHEPFGVRLLIAAALMGLGVWLHLTERHEHEHRHEALEHEHEHEHDEHHQHAHSEDVLPGARHTHRHRHEPLTHSHPHYPDSHHRHGHADDNHE